MLKYKVLLLAFVMIALTGMTGWAQIAGDYRSVTTGTWQTLSTWQRYSGTAWVTPTSAQGWPGQIVGTNDVAVMAGHVVTIGTGGISTLSFNSLNIGVSGRLYLTGSNQTVTFTLNTTVLTIADGGDVYFFNKSKLVLSPEAAITLVISQNGLVASTCNNNAELWIGPVKYAVCAGAPGDIFTFDQLIAAGGTLNAIPTSNSPICQGSTINLTGNYGGAIGTTPTYSWLVTAPGGTQTTYTDQNVTIPSAVTGTYTARLTVTTTLSGTTYTNSETIPVVVNALPTLNAVSQVITVCNNTQATINLTGLVPNTTYTVNYKINGVAQTAITGLIATAGATGSFLTPNLTTTNNGQTLEVTGITITNPTTNCATTFSGKTATLSVWTTGPGTWTGLVNSDWNDGGNWCSGVPTAATDVYIPAPSTSVPNQPLISIADALCNSITISSGATLSMSNARTLNVDGNWVNDGSFSAGNGIVAFSGSSAQSIQSATTFNSVSVSNSNGVTATSDIGINGILNLTNNPSPTKGALDLADGTTLKTLTLGPNAVCTGTGDLTGKIVRNSIQPDVTYTFGHPNTSIRFYNGASGDMPSSVKFITRIGSTHSKKTDAVQRYYEIIKTGGNASVTKFSLKFHYLDNELNSNLENTIVFWDHHVPYNGISPHMHGKSDNSTTENWMLISGHSIGYLVQNEYTGEIAYVDETTTPQNQSKIWMLANKVANASDFTWLGATDSDWNKISNWVGSIIPTQTSDVVIPDASTTAHDLKLSNGNWAAKTFTIEPGGIVDGETATLTIVGSLLDNNGTSSWSNDGTFNAGSSTVIFNSTNSAISGTTTFNNLTIPTGMSLGLLSSSATNVSGTFTNSGTFYASYDGPTTFGYTGADQNIVLPEDYYHHLNVSGTGTKTLPSGTTNIKGDLTLSAAIDASTNSSIVAMNGTSTQTIGGTAPATFNNLAINNAAGVTLGNSQTVNGNLTLTSGLITTGANTLTHGCDGIITGQSATSYIDGKLARVYCAPAPVSKEFPIGKGGNYRPLTLNYTALDATSTVTAEQFENVIPGSLPANAYTQNRYWNIIESGSTEGTYSLTLNGNPFNPGDGVPVILKGNGTTNSAIAATYSSPDFTIAGQTTFSNFAVATECEQPTITQQPVATAACAETGTATFNVTATVTNGTPTYQWQESTTGTGGTFADIANGGVYSNSATASLSITNPPYSMNTYAYRVVISRDCGSSITSNSMVLTVNELPTITLEDNPEACYGSTTADLAYTATTSSPTLYSINYDDAAITDVADAILEESPIELVLPSDLPAGTYAGTLTVKNSTTTCESVEYPFTVTIYALPQGSLTGNAVCSGGTGLLTFTATAGTGPFTVVYDPGNVSVPNVVSGTPFSVGNVSATTTYTLVSVTGTHCPRNEDFTDGTATITLLTDDATYTWTGSQSDDWNNAANWDEGFVPSSCINVIIPVVANFPTLYSAGACKNITIESGASLMDNSLLSIGGTASVERVIANDWKWHFISSPVTAQPIWPQFAPTPNAELKWIAPWNWDFYYYNPNAPISGGYYWVNLRQDAVANYNNSPIDDMSIYAGYGAATPVMTVGRGYLVAYGPDYNVTGMHTFTGSLNSGIVSRGILNGANEFNLVGNPYASSIDWKSSSGWGRSNLALNGSGYDYWIWNDAEGNYGVFNSAGTSGTLEVTKDIAPMQAFFVRASTSGSLSMSNAVRVHSTQPWLKNRQAENNLLRLKLTTQANTYSDEMIVAFDPSQSDGGSDKFWSMYTEAPEIFSVKDGNNYSIDRYADISAEMVVNLGAKCGVESTYTLTATNISEFGLANHVYLTDLKTGIRINLKETGSYTFNGSPNDDVTRFKLTFAGTIGIETPVVESRTEIYAHNGMIYITGLEVKADIAVTNLLGQVVQRTMAKGNDLTILNAGNLPKGIYVVSVFSNGQSISRKVVL